MLALAVLKEPRVRCETETSGLGLSFLLGVLCSPFLSAYLNLWVKSDSTGPWEPVKSGGTLPSAGPSVPAGSKKECGGSDLSLIYLHVIGKQLLT